MEKEIIRVQTLFDRNVTTADIPISELVSRSNWNAAQLRIKLPECCKQEEGS